MSTSAGATSDFRLAVPGAQPVGAIVPAAMTVVIGFTTLLAAVLCHDLSGVVATVLFGGVFMLGWLAPLQVPCSWWSCSSASPSIGRVTPRAVGPRPS